VPLRTSQRIAPKCCAYDLRMTPPPVQEHSPHTGAAAVPEQRPVIPSLLQVVPDGKDL
jgi:hypothetical protein